MTADALTTINQEIADLEERLTRLYGARDVMTGTPTKGGLGVIRGKKKSEVDYIDVIREILPVAGMPIRELRLKLWNSAARKSDRKHMVDLAIRTLETAGSIVIRKERVFLPEHDPEPGKPSQALPKEWYHALDPVL